MHELGSDNMEDTFENMKKLFNAENYMKASEQQKIERSKIDQLKAFQKKEKERLNCAVKVLREEREHRILKDDHLEQQKAEILCKHRKFHARKVLALPDIKTLPASKSGGRRRSANLSSGSGDTVASDDQDFALTFLKHAELPKIEKKIEAATKHTLPPISSKSVPFLQLLRNW